MVVGPDGRPGPYAEAIALILENDRAMSLHRVTVDGLAWAGISVLGTVRADSAMVNIWDDENSRLFDVESKDSWIAHHFVPVFFVSVGRAKIGGAQLTEEGKNFFSNTIKFNNIYGIARISIILA